MCTMKVFHTIAGIVCVAAVVHGVVGAAEAEFLPHLRDVSNSHMLLLRAASVDTTSHPVSINLL